MLLDMIYHTNIRLLDSVFDACLAKDYKRVPVLCMLSNSLVCSLDIMSKTKPWGEK